MTHTLSYNIFGLVIARHNKIRDELIYLSQRVFTSAYVRAEPLIYQGRTRSELGIHQGSYKHTDKRGDTMIRGLWDFQVDAIIDVKLEESNADTYKFKPMTSLLARWENIKKDRNGKHCHDQHKHFLLFVFSARNARLRRPSRAL